MRGTLLVKMSKQVRATCEVLCGFPGVFGVRVVFPLNEVFASPVVSSCLEYFFDFVFVAVLNRDVRSECGIVRCFLK